MRNVITKHGGNLGHQRQRQFPLHERWAFCASIPLGIDQDELELYLMDHGLDEMGEGSGEKGEPQIVIRGALRGFRASCRRR